jgi:hypothetical protein
VGRGSTAMSTVGGRAAIDRAERGAEESHDERSRAQRCVRMSCCVTKFRRPIIRTPCKGAAAHRTAIRQRSKAKTSWFLPDLGVCGGRTRRTSLASARISRLPGGQVAGR